MTTSREAFERWCRSQGYSNQPSTCWEAWQASRAALLEEIKAGGAVAWIDREGDVMPMPVIEHWCPPHYELYRLPEGEV
jgi:hypothetical protein